MFGDSCYFSIQDVADCYYQFRLPDELCGMFGLRPVRFDQLDVPEPEPQREPEPGELGLSQRLQGGDGAPTAAELRDYTAVANGLRSRAPPPPPTPFSLARCRASTFSIFFRIVARAASSRRGSPRRAGR